MTDAITWLSSNPVKATATIFVVLAGLGLACLIQNHFDKRSK
jgi:hypothetical protein